MIRLITMVSSLAICTAVVWIPIVAIMWLGGIIGAY